MAVGVCMKIAALWVALWARRDHLMRCESAAEIMNAACSVPIPECVCTA